MIGATVANVLTLNPAHLSGAAAIARSISSAVPRLARILRFSGNFWATWLALAFAARACPVSVFEISPGSARGWPLPCRRSAKRPASLTP